MNADAIGASSPGWYRRRSAVFAGAFAIAFLGGWAISVAMVGRYQPAFETIGAIFGARGPLFAGFAALALVFVAMAIRVWGSAYLNAATVWDEEVHAETFIVAGPFRFVRHPLYAANMLFIIGFAAAAPLIGWLFVIVVDAIFIRSLIHFEEERFIAVHGDAYRDYRKRVPAVIPRLVPVPARQSVRPSLAQGLSAESFTLFLIAGMVSLFTVPRYGVVGLILCYAAGVLVQRRIEQK